MKLLAACVTIVSLAKSTTFSPFLARLKTRHENAVEKASDLSAR